MKPTHAQIVEAKRLLDILDKEPVKMPELYNPRPGSHGLPGVGNPNASQLPTTEERKAARSKLPVLPDPDTHKRKQAIQTNILWYPREVSHHEMDLQREAFEAGWRKAREEYHE